MEPLLVGRALLGAGRFDKAAEELERAVQWAQRTGATGTLALAVAALDQALIMNGRATVGRRPDGPREVEVEAILAESDGLVALLQGDTEAATSAFALAIQRWQQLGLTVWLGRALSLQAEAVRQSRDSRRSRRLRSRAASILDRIKTPARHQLGVLTPIP
jgi:hypothetical protein